MFKNHYCCMIFYTKIFSANDLDEWKTWIQTILNANLSVTNDTVIYELHWPENFETVKVHGGKLRAKYSPSVWLG